MEKMAGLDFKLLLVDQVKHILTHFDTKRIVIDPFGRKKMAITFLTPKLPFLTRIFAWKNEGIIQMEESNEKRMEESNRINYFDTVRIEYVQTNF